MDLGITIGKYLGGRVLGFEAHAVMGATAALGHNVDFANISDRIMIGHASAFLAHGYSEQEFLDYVRTGVLPK